MSDGVINKVAAIIAPSDPNGIRDLSVAEALRKEPVLQPTQEVLA